MAIPAPIPSPTDNDRCSIKVSRPISLKLKALARPRKLSAGEIIGELIAANESRSFDRHNGALQALANSVSRLEESHVLCSETLVELAQNLVAISARLDDGGNEFLQRLGTATAPGESNNNG